MKLFSFLSNYPFHTKISVTFAVLMFLAIPVTVLSVQNFRDARLKAATNLGDPFYPDPTTSWTKEPYYEIETCLNTQSRGGSFCSKRTQTGGDSIRLDIAKGFKTYYWVDTLLYSNYPNVAWVKYADGSKSCPSSTSASTCKVTISWPEPVQRAQATRAGDPNSNACTGGPSTCKSSVDVTYPGKTAQFQDFPANLNFDVYIFIKGKLFDSKTGFNSGAAAAFGRPKVLSPVYGATGQTTNPTFQWTKVDGASRYGVWVSETNNFGTSPYWSVDVQQSNCSANCSKVWNSGGWASRNGAPSAPATLASGKTYYWLVWACLANSCPITGVNGINNFTTVTTTQVAPVLKSPTGANASNNPTFQWTPASGATSYTLGFSDKPDVLSFNGIYYRRTFGCGTNCSLSWNNGSGWGTFGSVDPKPYVLVAGKTYYWFVWACNTECPLSGIATSSFTVAGASVAAVPPSLVSPVNNVAVDNGKPTFVWNKASGITVNKYRLLLKRDSNNFSIGDYWIKDLAPTVCPATGNCSSDLSGTWAWQKNRLDNPATPPNPLSGGNWSWIVFACKTTACGLADLVASNPSYFKVGSVSATTADNLTQEIGACNNEGRVDTRFRWTPSTTPGLTEQRIWLSTQNNAFMPGTYLEQTLNFGIVDNWNWVGLISNAPHYWRVGSKINGYWYDSGTRAFTTPVCQISGGDQHDLNRPGTKNDIINYIYQITANDGVYRHAGYNLGDVLVYVMAGNGGLSQVQGGSANGESGGGTCAYNPAYQTVGVFQYVASTWRGQTQYGSFEARDAYDSGGVRNGPNCWKAPGEDPPTWASTFGTNLDNNGWNPYAQARATRKFFLGGGHCNWSVYSLRFGC